MEAFSQDLLNLVGATFFLFGAAAVCALIAIIVAVRTRRLPWRSALLAVAFGAGAGYFAAHLPPGYSADEVRRVEAVRVAVLTPVIERHQAAHGGGLPSGWEALQMEPPQTLYGPLQYWAKRDEDGRPYYILGMADYFRYGFNVFWDSRYPERGWEVDES
jgi:hypothetical protein